MMSTWEPDGGGVKSGVLPVLTPHSWPWRLAHIARLARGRAALNPVVSRLTSSAAIPAKRGQRRNGVRLVQTPPAATFVRGDRRCIRSCSMPAQEQRQTLVRAARGEHRGTKPRHGRTGVGARSRRAVAGRAREGRTLHRGGRRRVQPPGRPDRHGDHGDRGRRLAVPSLCRLRDRAGPCAAARACRHGAGALLPPVPDGAPVPRPHPLVGLPARGRERRHHPLRPLAGRLFRRPRHHADHHRLIWSAWSSSCCCWRERGAPPA